MASYPTTAFQRNIVVVGLEDSEKKSVAEYICQGDNIKALPSQYDRRSGYYEPMECIMKFEEAEYKIAVIDTQGLSRDPRKNKVIIKQIQEAVTYHFANEIHLVIFVISFGRVTNDVRVAIEQFFKYTNPDIINASAVVFSRCNLTPNAWNDYKEALYRDVEWSSKMKLGCHYVDFAEIDKMTERSRLTSLDRIRISTCNLQKLIRQARSSHSISLSDNRTIFKEYDEENHSCCCCFRCCCRCCRNIYNCCIKLCHVALTKLIACVLCCFK